MAAPGQVLPTFYGVEAPVLHVTPATRAAEDARRCALVKAARTRTLPAWEANRSRWHGTFTRRLGGHLGSDEPHPGDLKLPGWREVVAQPAQAVHVDG